ncbi:hypothetical protein [Leuconostoc mesenteroides]|uniref:hypothetical protein n=1 Tax=Leuconostoc mesenteroides TaxID=1245 RepID=UPI002360FD5F|nr:hypothetical protein [Leuconostoc mesenteroides]
MNKKWFWLLMVVLGIVIFVGGPLFVQYTHWPQGITGHGDWLSFWGSYLGIIPSGLIAYAVAWYQIDHEKSVEQKRQLENGLPYVKISYSLLQSVGKVRTYALDYEIKSYDGNPLIFEGLIRSFKDEGVQVTLIKGLNDNGQGNQDKFNSEKGVELYEVTITMFNGTKVFVTNNNSEKELVHLYSRNEGNKWDWYGIKPTSNALIESIEKAKVVKFD